MSDYISPHCLKSFWAWPRLGWDPFCFKMAAFGSIGWLLAFLSSDWLVVLFLGHMGSFLPTHWPG